MSKARLGRKKRKAELNVGGGPRLNNRLILQFCKKIDAK